MFQFGYQKVCPLNVELMAQQYVDKNDSYAPFDISGLQYYNPIYSRFFSMKPDNFNKVSLNQYQQAVDLQTVQDINGQTTSAELFVKFSPLLDPLKFLTGKYKLDDPMTTRLPQLDLSLCHPKIANVNNCSYTDAFFCYLSHMLHEQHGWLHGVKYYGTALAIQNRFRFNLADDYDFVEDSPYFFQNLGKHFTLDEQAALLLQNGQMGSGSRGNRPLLDICNDDNDDLSLDFEPLDEEKSASKSDKNDDNDDDMLSLESETESDKSKTDKSKSDELESLSNESSIGSSCSSGSSCSDSTMFSSSDEESVWETESESETESCSESETESCSESMSEESFSESEEPLYCYLHNFPTQMIFMEKCKSTIDSLLLKKQLTDEQVIAAFMQVIMILLTYNRAFDFTHNDLHTNNIMYQETEVEYLYYKVDNVFYRVPTYGRIFKIIDFGRAIYRFQGKVFCSDSFAYNGDAYSQYNCEPFLNEDKPRLEPNPSFDLCRLACSLCDFFDEDTKGYEKTCEIVNLWRKDDEGKDVVYKGHGQERYPGFKLYKMIARTVHAHTPKNQLDNPVFKTFIFGDKPETFMDLDLYRN